MPDRTVLLDGAHVPRFLYGTAWKEDRTLRLTGLAHQGYAGVCNLEITIGQMVARQGRRPLWLVGPAATNL